MKREQSNPKELMDSIEADAIDDDKHKKLRKTNPESPGKSG